MNVKFFPLSLGETMETRIKLMEGADEIMEFADLEVPVKGIFLQVIHFVRNITPKDFCTI